MKCVFAVKIIGIDYSKRCVYLFRRYQQGMACSPGLGSACRGCVGRGNTIQFLCDKFEREMFAVPGSTNLFKFRLKIFADYKYNLAKPARRAS